MNKKNYFLFHFFFYFALCFSQSYKSFSQIKDTAKIFVKNDTTKVNKAKHNPKLATKRSLILPGWGQAYNKEYWKIPIVYGALSIPTITFIYNHNIYKETKFAYEARFKASVAGGKDSTDFRTLETKYQKADANAIQSLRNAARRDRDYSVFWFLIVWGLNVADATVFGHLKDFDVSNSLALNIKPDFNTTTKTPAINFTLKLKNKKQKQIFDVK